MTVKGQTKQIVKETPISKIIRAKMDWRFDLSSRAPALQVRSPKFKPQSYPKKVFHVIKNAIKVHMAYVFKAAF
jgi:hypothetical protein